MATSEFFFGILFWSFCTCFWPNKKKSRRKRPGLHYSRFTQLKHLIWGQIKSYYLILKFWHTVYFIELVQYGQKYSKKRLNNAKSARRRESNESTGRLIFLNWAGFYFLFLFSKFMKFSGHIGFFSGVFFIIGVLYLLIAQKNKLPMKKAWSSLFSIHTDYTFDMRSNKVLLSYAMILTEFIFI